MHKETTGENKRQNHIINANALIKSEAAAAAAARETLK